MVQGLYVQQTDSYAWQMCMSCTSDLTARLNTAETSVFVDSKLFVRPRYYTTSMYLEGHVATKIHVGDLGDRSASYTIVTMPGQHSASTSRSSQLGNCGAGREASAVLAYSRSQF